MNKILLLNIFFMGCAVESHRELTPQVVKAYSTNYRGEKQVIAIGSFSNESNYQRGIFSSNKDYLGNQARNILKSHLRLTNRFFIADRVNLKEIQRESKFSKVQQNIRGAEFLVSGSIVSFGRKVIGNQQLFGIIGSGKKQIAYCKVAINIIDVKTAEVLSTVQGEGEYALSSREIVGFGTSVGYDGTLNGKVIDLAIRSAINNLIIGLKKGHIIFK